MNTKEQNDLRQKVHKTLIPYYTSKGFTLDKSNGVFNKNGLEVEWGVSSKNVDYLYFNPILTVMNEDIRNSLQNILERKKFGIAIRRIAGHKLAQEFEIHEYDYLGNDKNHIDHGCTYKVDFESDLSELVKDHLNYMEKVGFPFFNKVESTQGVYEYLSGLFFNQADIIKILGKREALSCLISGYIINAKNIKETIRCLENTYRESPFVWNDLEKIINHFEE